jgi:hypothetical protein
MGQAAATQRVSGRLRRDRDGYLRELGCEPVPAQDTTAFGIDLAIRHPATGQFCTCEGRALDRALANGPRIRHAA